MLMQIMSIGSQEEEEDLLGENMIQQVLWVLVCQAGGGNWTKMWLGSHAKRYLFNASSSSTADADFAAAAWAAIEGDQGGGSRKTFTTILSLKLRGLRQET